jgi:hypothetical protein
MTGKDVGGERRASKRQRRIDRIETALGGAARDAELLAKKLQDHEDRQDYQRLWGDGHDGDLDAASGVAAVERFYERIINELNATIDAIEALRDEAGLTLPQPEPASEPRPASGERPGRWRRLANNGVIPHDDVDTWKRLAERRNEIQKEYAEHGRVQAGRFYDDAIELVKRAPRIIKGLKQWADQSTGEQS